MIGTDRIKGLPLLFETHSRKDCVVALMNLCFEELGKEPHCSKMGDFDS
jgi:hypothetical protein